MPLHNLIRLGNEKYGEHVLPLVGRNPSWAQPAQDRLKDVASQIDIKKAVAILAAQAKNPNFDLAPAIGDLLKKPIRNVYGYGHYGYDDASSMDSGPRDGREHAINRLNSVRDNPSLSNNQAQLISRIIVMDQKLQEIGPKGSGFIRDLYHDIKRYGHEPIELALSRLSPSELTNAYTRFRDVFKTHKVIR